MVKLPLKGLLCTSCVVLGTAGHVSAGGLERGGYNIDLLFNPDRFATEVTSIYVMPNRKLNAKYSVTVVSMGEWKPPVGGKISSHASLQQRTSAKNAELESHNQSRRSG